jgi:hypothetical protein
MMRSEGLAGLVCLMCLCCSLPIRSSLNYDPRLVFLLTGTADQAEPTSLQA